MNKIFKRILIYCSMLLGVFILFILGYVAFILISYNRIEDNLSLDIDGSATNDVVEVDK